MRKYQLLLGLFLFVLVFVPGSIAAQSYGEWDRPCDSGYSERFAYPFSSGVMFGGKEFLTRWKSESDAKPLPSLNWYAPTPDSDPVSTDKTKRWYNAGVQVHCWVQRTPYWVSHMADPVSYRGSLAENCNRGAGGEWTIEPPPDGESYDPYDAAYAEECSGTTEQPESGSGTAYRPGDSTGGETVNWGTGRGNGGSSVCGAAAVVEYICIDIWIEEIGWVKWDCGYVTTC